MRTQALVCRPGRHRLLVRHRRTDVSDVHRLGGKGLGHEGLAVPDLYGAVVATRDRHLGVQRWWRAQPDGDRATFQSPVDKLGEVPAGPAAVARHRRAAEPGRDNKGFAHEMERYCLASHRAVRSDQ